MGTYWNEGTVLTWAYRKLLLKILASFLSLFLGKEVVEEISPLSPGIIIQILLTDLHTFH